MRAFARSIVSALLLSLIYLAPSAAFGQPAESDHELLRGTWLCVGTLLDGKPVDRYVGVRAVFEGDNLIWFFPQSDGSYREQKNKFRVDPDHVPAHFDWWSVDAPAAVDLRLYSVSDELLLWATNLDSKTRPETFNDARWQFVMGRVVEDDPDARAAEIPGWGTMSTLHCATGDRWESRSKR